MTGDRGRHVGVQPRVVAVHEPPFDDRVIQPLAGRDHPRVVLREGRDPNPALFELLADLPRPPRIEGALRDRVPLGQLVDHVGELEHGTIARQDLAADLQLLVQPDDRRVGAFTADVDADDDPLTLLEVGLARAGLPGADR